MTRTDLLQSLNPIKVVIIGNSNSGKSTLVNALCGRFVVPESSHTSTMLTTFIGKVKGCPVDQVIVTTKGRMKRMSIDEFRTSIVYQNEGIYDELKNKFAHQIAFVNIIHPLSHSGMVIVDTIGTGINKFDIQETASVVKKADIVVYVHDASRSYNLMESEVSFLRQVLFPNKGKSYLPCDRIFIVPNKVDCVTSIAELIRTLNFSLLQFVNKQSPEYRALCNNIIPISALMFRIGTAGVLRYELFRMDKFSSEEKQIVDETIQFELKIEQKYQNSLFYKSNVLCLMDSLIECGNNITKKNQQQYGK